MRSLRGSAFIVAVAMLSHSRGQAQELMRPKIDAATIEASLASDWYGVYLGGKKIGWFNARRQAEGKDKIRDSFVMSLKLASFGKKSEMTISQDMIFEREAPHRLLRGQFKQDAGPVVTQTLIERSGKGFDVLTTSGKTTAKKTLADVDYTLADTLVSEVWLRGGPKEGDVIAHREFSMEDLKLDTQTSKLLARKTTKVGGREVPFFEVETLSNRQKVKMKTLHDDQGRLLSGNVAIFELRREPEDQAKNTEFTADLFVLGQAKVDQPLGDIERLKEVVLEVLGKGGDVIPSGPRQTIDRADGKRVLKIGSSHGKPAKATEQEIKEALEETIALPITHPKIVALAKEAAGDAGTPEDKVKAITRFTFKYIRPSLTTALPEIHHLIERKSGDCKCYARLFTALARANGVPAREVSGFVYMGDGTRAFGGHAWNEVVLDGHWTPVDASMNRVDTTPGHIYLGGERDAASILETLGNLNFRLIEKR